MPENPEKVEEKKGIVGTLDSSANLLKINLQKNKNIAG
jgi:hypothetical protein